MTTWLLSPICNATFQSALSRAVDNVSLVTYVLKPGTAICTSYSPSGKARLYFPVPSVTAEKIAPVEIDFTCTATFGTTAPVGSVTTPDTDAVFCDSRIAPNRATKAHIPARLRFMLHPFSFPQISRFGAPFGASIHLGMPRATENFQEF